MAVCGVPIRKVKENLNMYPSTTNKSVKCHARFWCVFWSIILRRSMFYSEHYLFGLSAVFSVSLPTVDSCILLHLSLLFKIYP